MTKPRITFRNRFWRVSPIPRGTWRNQQTMLLYKQIYQRVARWNALGNETDRRATCRLSLEAQVVFSEELRQTSEYYAQRGLDNERD